MRPFLLSGAELRSVTMPTNALQTIPEWPTPRPTRLNLATPSVSMIQHFHNWLDGLKEIRLFVHEGAEIQRWILSSGYDDPEQLAMLVWFRAERQARRTKKQVTFRVHLIGRNEEGPFERQKRFRIKPADFLSEDQEENDEIADEDRPPELDNSMGSREDDADESQDEGDDRQGRPQYSDVDETPDDPYDGTADDDADTQAVAQRGSYQVAKGEHPEAHISPQMMLRSQAEAQAQTLHLAHRAYSAPMKENRMLVHEFRQEMSATIRDIKLSAQMQLGEHMAMTNKLLAHQNEMFAKQTAMYEKMMGYSMARNEMLEKQIAESQKLNAAHIHNFQELAKQGWQAFLDAMKMKSESLDERIDWTRWAAEEMQNMRPAQAQERAGPHWIVQAGSSPMLMGGLSMVMRALGKTREADMMERLATNASRGGDDDEEEDEEEEPEAPGGHGPNGSSHGFGFGGTPPGAGAPGAPGFGAASPGAGARRAPPRPSAPTPFADRARAFRSSLSPQTLVKFKGALPRKAVVAFDTACGAADDAVAIAALRKLKDAVQGDVAVMARLAAELDEAQLSEILAVVEAIEKAPGARARRKPPTRPTAD